MQYLATPGALIEVTPWDEIYYKTDPAGGDYIKDPTPFVFRVEGRLEDGQIFYGLYGPVVSGPERYHNLICNIVVRADGSDWRNTTECMASFYVGPAIATRDHVYDFRHPDGIVIAGLPRISRFSGIRVVKATDGD